jgi:hypothetical protein
MKLDHPLLSFVYPSQPFLPAKVRTFVDLALAWTEEVPKRMTE